MQVRQVRQKIIPDKEGKEDEIVDNTFEIVREIQRRFEMIELELKIFAKNRQVQ